MTRVYTSRQQRYIQSFMFKGEALLKEAFAPDQPDDASWSARLDKLSLAIDTATAVTAIVGVATAPPSLGLALVGAGAGIVVLQAANGVVGVTQRLVDSQAAVVTDETRWDTDFLTWSIDVREVAEGAALRYRHAIDNIMEERALEAFAHVGAERVIKKLKETLSAGQVISPADLVEHLMFSSMFFITHAERFYARSRMMVCQKTAPFTLAYHFYRSRQEHKYLQMGTSVAYGYMSISSPVLTPEITRQNRRFVALTNMHDMETQVMPHLCVEYSVTWDEVSVYLTDMRREVASGQPRRSLNQYLADRLDLKVIAECHGDVLKGRDLSGGDFSDINARDLHLDGCNLEDTNWSWAHLERACFHSNALKGAVFQNAFLEKSTWSAVELMGNFSHARMRGATLTCCTITASLQDRGCVWDRAVLDHVVMAEGLEETWKRYADEQHEAIQRDLDDLTRQCQENEAAISARNAALRLALDGVVEQVHHLQIDVRQLNEKPLRDLQVLMHSHIETLFDDVMLPFYVDLNIASSGTGNTEALPLWDRLDQYMGNDQELFFLLHGDIGSGKSLSVQRLAQQLAQQHAAPGDWFPVYIKLKHINDRSSDNFLDAALRTLFSLEQIKMLKASCRCVIILDGLDECGIDYSQRAVLEECCETMSQWAKGPPKIILTTQTRCLIDRNYHQLLRISPGIQFPRQSEYAIQPLNDAQIESYLQSYYPTGMNLAEWDTSFAEIKAMATSPIMLHIICVVLQASEGRGMALKSREAFYDAFMHYWSMQVISKRPMEHFTEESIKKYCRRMAFQMYVEKKSSIDRPYEAEEKEPLQLEEDRRLHVADPFTCLFDDTLWKKAGWLSPMTAKLRMDRLPWVVENAFLHKSFQYRDLAHYLIDKICRGSETERLTDWNFSYLVDSFDVFDFFTRIIQTHPQKKPILSALKAMVSASAAPGGARWGIAASNAITLLNALRVDFSTLLQPSEWRGICIPRANLNGALLASVDLRDSDLSYVVFDDAILAACDIGGSNVDGTRFTDFQLFGMTAMPPAFLTVRPSDPWIVTYDEEDVDSKQHKMVSRGLDGAIYPDLSGHMDKIRAGAWVESNGEERFASAGDGKTVRVQRLVDKGTQGEEVAKLKDRAQGVVLSLSWSKDGNILAVAGAFQNVLLWDIDEKKCEVVPAFHQGTVRSVVLGQSQAIMLSAGDDRTVRLWNLRIDERKLTSISKNPKEKRLPSAINALTLSASEHEFAAACSDSNIYLYSTTRDLFPGATALRVLQGHNDAVTSVIWNAWRLVSSSNDSTVRVWDVSNGACVSTFQGDGRPVKQVAWLPGGRQVMAGGGGKSRMLFIVDTDAQSMRSNDLEGLTHRVSSIAPYGQYLATGSIDGKVWLWDIKTQPYSARTILDHAGAPVLQIEWSQDGQYIASRSDQNICVCDMDREKGGDVIPFDRDLLFHHMAWVTDRASKQSWLALGGSDGQIHLWMYEMQREQWAPWLVIPWDIDKVRLPICCVAAAPSRRSIFEAEMPSMGTMSTDFSPVLPMGEDFYDDSPVTEDFIPSGPLPSSDEISTSGGSNAATNSLAASVGSVIRIWDLRQESTPDCIKECMGHKQTIVQLTWSPDGRFLASMDEVGVVWVWETSNWTCVFKDMQATDEKHMAWSMIGEDKLWLVLAALDEIHIFDALNQFERREPIKQLTWGADKLSFHAGLLYVVQNRSVDMISLVQLLFGDLLSPFWVGRIGHGLCMKGCIATDVKNISPATKAFIKNLGAVVSDETAGWSWRFWNRRPSAAVMPFPARAPSVSQFSLFSPPRQETSGLALPSSKIYS